MIVRAILTRPVVEPFDWFNDYKDTLGWLRSGPQTPELIEATKRFQEAYQKTERIWG